MNRRQSLKALTAGCLAVLTTRTDLLADLAPQRMTVYKSPTCGCCGDWIKHVKAAGFDVVAVNVDVVEPYKKKHGVPLDLASCHTGVIGEYAFEGHVPADLIKRFLKSPPKGARGLAVPGMPLGSPGMEVGGRKDAYDVMVFDKAGKRSVYAKL
jgi:hypothetical protein